MLVCCRAINAAASPVMNALRVNAASFTAVPLISHTGGGIFVVSHRHEAEPESALLDENSGSDG
jgi:hypothetical protein